MVASYGLNFRWKEEEPTFKIFSLHLTTVSAVKTTAVSCHVPFHLTHLNNFILTMSLALNHYPCKLFYKAAVKICQNWINFKQMINFQNSYSVLFFSIIDQWQTSSCLKKANIFCLVYIFWNKNYVFVNDSAKLIWIYHVGNWGEPRVCASTTA
jgi:hypothetical protein